MPPIYTPPQRTAADTVAALHRLFNSRRGGGGLLIGVGIITFLVTPFAATPSGPPTSTYGNLPEFIGGVRLGIIIASPIVALGTVQLLNSSKEKEELAILQYMQAHALSKKLAKKLRPELFLPVNSTSRYR